MVDALDQADHSAPGRGGEPYRITVLGTGGTIAGVSRTGNDRDYEAAQLGIDALLAAVPALSGLHVHARQVAQIDSKDMGWPVWRVLLSAVLLELDDPEVAGIVITHGTDTLEETAWLLHVLLSPRKPVVLTAAMRPASSAEADGPGNLRDALAVAHRAAQQGQSGVVACLHGRVWAAQAVRKAHTRHIDAFDGGPAQPLALWANGEPLLGMADPWPAPFGWLLARADVSLNWPDQLPPVALVTSHADADGLLIDAWSQACGIDRLDTAHHAAPHWGLVVAGTGHGTIHEAMFAAVKRAQARGAVVWRSTRVPAGGVQPAPDETWPATGELTALQARLALSLALWLRPDRAVSWAQASVVGS